MTIRKFLLALSLLSVLGGLIGCGGKKEEEGDKVDPAVSKQFESPKTNMSGAPGGAGATNATSKPVTQ